MTSTLAPIKGGMWERRGGGVTFGIAAGGGLCLV